MSAKKITTRIQNKHDLEVNWLNATNFKPLAGEIVVYDTEVDENGNVLVDAEGNPKLPKNKDGTYSRTEPYTYERMKIGDGRTPVNKLPFFGIEQKSEERYAPMEVGDTTTYGIRWLGAASIPEIENLPIAEGLDIFKCVDNTGYEGTFSIWYYDDMGQRIYQTFPGINGAVDVSGMDFYSSWQQLLKEDSSNAFGYMDPPETLGITSIEITWIADWAKPYLEIYKEVRIEDQYVSFDSQKLTEEQKAQARENIGLPPDILEPVIFSKWIDGNTDYSDSSDGIKITVDSIDTPIYTYADPSIDGAWAYCFRVNNIDFGYVSGLYDLIYFPANKNNPATFTLRDFINSFSASSILSETSAPYTITITSDAGESGEGYIYAYADKKRLRIDTDKSLTHDGLAADAKVVGDTINNLVSCEYEFEETSISTIQEITQEHIDNGLYWRRFDVGVDDFGCGLYGEDGSTLSFDYTEERVESTDSSITLKVILPQAALGQFIMIDWWNESGEEVKDPCFLNSKPKNIKIGNININIATDEDVMEILSTVCSLEPVTTSNGAILTDNSGAVYTI